MSLFIENRPKMPIAPILLNAPHGGRIFPVDFSKTCLLSEEKRLVTADLGTDELVERASDFYSLRANFARAFVDLNRAPDLLDPKLVEGAPKGRDLYMRAGYGVLPRFSERGSLLQKGKITMQEACARLDWFYHPYHAKLQEMIAELKSIFGWVLLIDIHSAPKVSIPDTNIVLGTAKMTSISRELHLAIHDIFCNRFRDVACDQPFSGGYITKNYGKPRQNEHALQVEISRSLLEGENRGLNQDFLKDWDIILEELIKLCHAQKFSVWAAQ